MPEVLLDVLEIVPEDDVPALCDLIAKELPLSRYVSLHINTPSNMESAGLHLFKKNQLLEKINTLNITFKNNVLNPEKQITIGKKKSEKLLMHAVTEMCYTYLVITHPFASSHVILYSYPIGHFEYFRVSKIQQTYGFVTTCHKWHKHNPDYEVSFYRLKNNFESGIFIGLLYSGNKSFALIPYARVGYENELEDSLLKTKKIDWSRLPLIQGILPRHTDIIERVVIKKNFLPKLYVDTTVQVLDSQTALRYNIKIPNEVYVKELTLLDIDSIYELWPHKDVYNIDEIKHSINLSISFGIFSRSNNEIQAWVLHVHYGALGMLYTKECVRRHGYAKILVKLMSKELAKQRIQPYAMIMESNIKSISLFHSVGYKQISPMKYIRVVQIN